MNKSFDVGTLRVFLLTIFFVAALYAASIFLIPLLVKQSISLWYPVLGMAVLIVIWVVLLAAKWGKNVFFFLLAITVGLLFAYFSVGVWSKHLWGKPASIVLFAWAGIILFLAAMILVDFNHNVKPEPANTTAPPSSSWLGRRTPQL